MSNPDHVATGIEVNLRDIQDGIYTFVRVGFFIALVALMFHATVDSVVVILNMNGRPRRLHTAFLKDASALLAPPTQDPVPPLITKFSDHRRVLKTGVHADASSLAQKRAIVSQAAADLIAFQDATRELYTELCAARKKVRAIQRQLDDPRGNIGGS